MSGGDDAGDLLDGGVGYDVITGDNARVERRGDTLNAQIRVLEGDLIYVRDDSQADGTVLVTPDSQLNPTGVQTRIIELLDHSDAARIGHLTGGEGF